AQERRQPGNDQAFPEDLEIERFQRPRVVGEGAGEVDRDRAHVLAERIGPDHRHRHEEEQGKPSDRRRGYRRECRLRLLPSLLHTLSPATLLRRADPCEYLLELTRLVVALERAVFAFRHYIGWREDNGVAP